MRLALTITSTNNPKAKSKATVTFIDPAYPTGLTLTREGTGDVNVIDTVIVSYKLIPNGAESEIDWNYPNTVRLEMIQGTNQAKIMFLKHESVKKNQKVKISITATSAKNKKAKSTLTFSFISP